jgi:transcriptional regulator with XRE-family HTH domain
MKRSKKQSGLHKLRTILDKSQMQMASMLGVSLGLVKSIEQGRRTVTEKLDRRIRVATGASLGRTVLRFDPSASEYKPSKYPIKWKPLSNGQIRSSYSAFPKYSIDAFRHHAGIFESTVAAAKERFKEIAPDLERMFIEAAKPGTAGNRNRLPAFEISLREWMEESSTQFHLK